MFRSLDVLLLSLFLFSMGGMRISRRVAVSKYLQQSRTKAQSDSDTHGVYHVFLDVYKLSVRRISMASAADPDDPQEEYDGDDGSSSSIDEDYVPPQAVQQLPIMQGTYAHGMQGNYAHGMQGVHELGGGPIPGHRALPVGYAPYPHAMAPRVLRSSLTQTNESAISEEANVTGRGLWYHSELTLCPAGSIPDPGRGRHLKNDRSFWQAQGAECTTIGYGSGGEGNGSVPCSGVKIKRKPLNDETPLISHWNKKKTWKYFYGNIVATSSIEEFVQYMCRCTAPRPGKDGSYRPPWGMDAYASTKYNCNTFSWTCLRKMELHPDNPNNKYPIQKHVGTFNYVGNYVPIIC